MGKRKRPLVLTLHHGVAHKEGVELGVPAAPQLVQAAGAAQEAGGLACAKGKGGGAGGGAMWHRATWAREERERRPFAREKKMKWYRGQRWAEREGKLPGRSPAGRSTPGRPRSVGLVREEGAFFEKKGRNGTGARADSRCVGGGERDRGGGSGSLSLWRSPHPAGRMTPGRPRRAPGSESAAGPLDLCEARRVRNRTINQSINQEGGAREEGLSRRWTEGRLSLVSMPPLPPNPRPICFPLAPWEPGRTVSRVRQREGGAGIAEVLT